MEMPDLIKEAATINGIANIKRYINLLGYLKNVRE